MSREYYESLADDLLKVINAFEAFPVTAKQLLQTELWSDTWESRLDWHRDYVEHGECGLAFEGLVDDASTLQLQLSEEILLVLHSLAQRMELDVSQVEHLQR